MVSHLLQSIPPEVVYLIVGLMIMVESLGIPVPGEIALVTAAVLEELHPSLRWRAPAIELFKDKHFEMHLEGRPLVLMPLELAPSQWTPLLPALASKA